MTSAVAGPIPARDCRSPCCTRRTSSPPGSPRTTSAARLKARTLYVGAPERSNSKAICRSAREGSIVLTRRRSSPALFDRLVMVIQLGGRRFAAQPADEHGNCPHDVCCCGPQRDRSQRLSPVAAQVYRPASDDLHRLARERMEAGLESSGQAAPLSLAIRQQLVCSP